MQKSEYQNKVMNQSGKRVLQIDGGTDTRTELNP